jgi:hypothetical protein
VVTLIEVGEALDRVVEALAGVSEDEVAAALADLEAVATGHRQPTQEYRSRTPLPGPGGVLNIHLEVEWV